jgi:hypothetical protein
VAAGFTFPVLLILSTVLVVLFGYGSLFHYVVLLYLPLLLVV